MSTARGGYLFAVFAHQDLLIKSIRAVKEGGFQEYQVFSPTPHHDIAHVLDAKPSPVRVFTLVGGLLGLAIGWGITIGPLTNYNLHVGGKPLVSIPPFGVVAYICTILFGALATLVGMIVNTRLPQVTLVEGYDPRLSSDHFGIQLFCPAEKMAEAEKLLAGSGAIDINHIHA